MENFINKRYICKLNCFLLILFLLVNLLFPQKILATSLGQYNTQEVIDEESSPKASPDGKYIVYTKTITKIRKVMPNVYIEENLQDLWLVSTNDFTSKKRITNNVLLKDIDEKTWLKNLKPSNDLQILSYSGKYCYLNPTWSSDCQSIYVTIRTYPSLNSGKKITSRRYKISLKKCMLSKTSTHFSK